MHVVFEVVNCITLVCLFRSIKLAESGLTGGTFSCFPKDGHVAKAIIIFCIGETNT